MSFYLFYQCALEYFFHFLTTPPLFTYLLIIFLSGNAGDFDGDAVIDTNVLPYCSIDQKKEKKSVGELEQEFLQALQVYIPPNLFLFFFH